MKMVAVERLRDCEELEGQMLASRTRFQMAHTKQTLTDDFIIFADTHDLPQEEVLIASGGNQGYTSNLIGEITAQNLDATDPRCRHFSWWVEP